MKTLNEIMQQTANLELALEQSGGELTPELEEELDALTKDMSNKVDSYGFLLRKMKANLDATKALAQQLQAAAKVKENNLKHLKEHLVHNMKLYNMDRLVGETCTLSLRSTSSLDVDEEKLLLPYAEQINKLQSELPSWIKVKTEVSKTTLKNEYGDSKEMPEGAEYKVSTSVNVR